MRISQHIVIGFFFNQLRADIDSIVAEIDA
jgi:hypothetical protein